MLWLGILGFLANIFHIKLSSDVPRIIPRNRPSCSFASFLIFSLMLFTSKPDSLRDLTIFMISLIPLF